MPTLRFRLTQEDMVSAARLHQLTWLTNPRTMIGLIAVILVVTTGIFAATRLDGDGFLDWLGIAAAFCAYAALALPLVLYFVAPIHARRQYREQKNLKEEYELAWNERSYIVKGATSQSDIPWADYHKWTENDRLMLLYVSSLFYQVLPKQALPPAAVDAIRSHLLEARVPAASSLLQRLRRP